MIAILDSILVEFSIQILMPAGRNSSKVLSQPSGKSDVVRSRAIERVLLFFMTE